jgi:hypothetical protein
MKLFDIMFIIDDGERQDGFDVRKVIQVVIQASIKSL